MPIDPLSGELTVKKRDEVHTDFLDAFQFRIPDAEVGKNTDPFVVGAAVADAAMPIYANAPKLAKATSWTTATGDDLTEYAEQIGRPRGEAVGGIGYVIIEAASGGGAILEGTELRYKPAGTRFRVLETKVYLPGELCAVQGIDTGPQTNVAAGATLHWLSPPAGILSTCEVFENTDGSGISGGAEEETDEELKAALTELHANPAASGNDADIIQFVQKLKGLAIQKAFCFPCVVGPGEYAVCFTMRPAAPGASRLPNGAQIAKVEAEVVAHFPGDDGAHFPTMLDHLVAPCIKVRWRSDFGSWVDAVPWPPYASSKVSVVASPTPTASSCRVNNCTTAPAVGNNVAFYDAATRTFKPKRIATVTSVGGNQYDVTFDMTGSVSDPTFVPASGAIVSPLAVDMSSLVEPILKYSDKQGPGEMYATFIDPGRRQRRVPESNPGSWPHTVTNSILDDIFELVADATLMEPTTPHATTVGTPGLLVYLHRISDIGLFEL